MGQGVSLCDIAPAAPQVCDTEYEKVCSTQYNTHCVDSVQTQCTTISVPKCTTQTNTVCNAEQILGLLHCCDVQVCEQQVRPELEPFIETECKTLYKEECEHRWEGEGNSKVWVIIPGTCRDEPYEECVDVAKTKERQVAFPVCQEVPYQHCVDLPQELCKDVPDRKCVEKPFEVCQDVPREVCHTEHKRVPFRANKQIPKQVSKGSLLSHLSSMAVLC